MESLTVFTFLFVLTTCLFESLFTGFRYLPFMESKRNLLTLNEILLLKVV
jgi:hypothetical protein